MIIPNALISSPNWVCWRLEEARKVPYSATTGRRASSTAPETWSDYRTAERAAWKHRYHGVAYVITPDSEIIGVDLDKCRDSKTGKLTPFAQSVVERLDSYSEVSQSGTGVHILIRGTLPGGRRRNEQIEMYDGPRAWIVTGQHIAGTPADLQPRQAQVSELYTEMFPVESAIAPQTRTAPLSLSDSELLDRARTARNGARFERLWSGDTSDYGGDRSRADAALTRMLAYWTGGDAERIDRLFRQSGLFREKWFERRGARTYGEITVGLACGG